MHGLTTRVRSHLTVIAYTPETSGSGSCDYFRGFGLFNIGYCIHVDVCSTHLGHDGKFPLAMLEVDRVIRFVVELLLREELRNIPFVSDRYFGLQ